MTDPNVRIYDLFLAAGYSAGNCAAFTRTLRRPRAGPAGLGTTLDDVSAPFLGRCAESIPSTSTSRTGLRSAISGCWPLTGPIGPVGAIRVHRHPQMNARALEDGLAGRLCADVVARLSWARTSEAVGFLDYQSSVIA